MEGKNQGDGEKRTKKLQTMSNLIGSGNINAAKNVVHEKAAEKKVHEKAAETTSEIEETSYELISQLEKDQNEEYTNKYTEAWNIDMEIQNQTTQENTKATFNTQHSRETRTAADSTGENSPKTPSISEQLHNTLH